MGNEGGDDEGDECDDAEGRQDAKGDLQGVGLQPEGHQVVTHAEAYGGAEGRDDAVCAEGAAQAIPIVGAEDTAYGYGTALALEVGTQQGYHSEEGNAQTHC